MTERIRLVTPLKIEYWCDECNGAAVEVSGQPLPNGKIPHYCPKCSTLIALDRGYPLIRFDDIAEEHKMPGNGQSELWEGQSAGGTA